MIYLVGDLTVTQGGCRHAQVPQDGEYRIQDTLQVPQDDTGYRINYGSDRTDIGYIILHQQHASLLTWVCGGQGSRCRQGTCKGGSTLLYSAPRLTVGMAFQSYRSISYHHGVYS